MRGELQRRSYRGKYANITFHQTTSDFLKPYHLDSDVLICQGTMIKTPQSKNKATKTKQCGFVLVVFSARHDKAQSCPTHIRAHAPHGTW